MSKLLISQGAKITTSEIDPYYLNNRVAYSANEELKNIIQPVISGELFTRTGGMEGYCDPSSFMQACSSGKLDAVEFMLKAGANPNVYCWPEPGASDLQCDKTSALALAESGGHQAVVELLKKYKAKKPKDCIE